MSALPPPVPLAPVTQRRPGASFVTVLAWISIAMAVLGVANGVIQVIAGLVMPAGYPLQMLDPGGAGLPPLPPLMQWYYANTILLAVGSLLVSLVFLAVSWGLLRRREWARRGFIALLVLGTLLQLTWVWAIPQIMEGTLAMQMAAILAADADVDAMEAMNKAVVTVATAVTAVMVLLFFALHAWLVWKLCTASVRAEFDPLRA